MSAIQGSGLEGFLCSEILPYVHICICAANQYIISTTYLEILAFIKFGDLCKIRL